MHPERAFAIVALTTSLIVGCGDDSVEPSGSTGTGQQGGGNEGGGPPDIDPTSQKAALKLKGGARFRNDIAQSLDLPVDYCKELGFVECSAVHTIVMGGADAFFSGLYEPLPETTATSPLAFDRFAMTGCVMRVDADLAAAPGAALIFRDLPMAGDGKLSDPSAPAVDLAITKLYQRGLARMPSEFEREQLRGLYPAIEQNGSSRPARDWAVLGCFSVLTSMENIFY